MNVLEIIRAKKVREVRVKDAQKASLCYRGVNYEPKAKPQN